MSRQRGSWPSKFSQLSRQLSRHLFIPPTPPSIPLLFPRPISVFHNGFCSAPRFRRPALLHQGACALCCLQRSALLLQQDCRQLPHCRRPCRSSLTCPATVAEGDLRRQGPRGGREGQEAQEVRAPRPAPEAGRRPLTRISGSMATRSSVRSPSTRSTVVPVASRPLSGRLVLCHSASTTSNANWRIKGLRPRL